MAVMFVSLHIPILDRYLGERYGSEYVEWRRHSKTLIPFIY
jgi:protein-S-isoprenylcysteine O-methyltransferase Ste14